MKSDNLIRTLNLYFKQFNSTKMLIHAVKWLNIEDRKGIK